MNELTPTAEMTVSEVLEAWPETALVFNGYRTACVGCAMAAFDTIDDVARIYHLDLEDFLQALQEVANGVPQSNSNSNFRE
ncbi:MAG TPA: hypothetical protein VK879_07100 [Candidatus Sulfomarinibacteraceae bacterium]|nr:hypothetical protein [Candidatus Sulfomarinibacteraceae bacterium]